MAIKITVSDTDGDGRGIGLAQYFADFPALFTPEGSIGFTGFGTPNPDDESQSGQYVSVKGQANDVSVLFNASKWFDFDLSSFVVSGKLASIDLGSAAVFSDAVCSNNPDVSISGFKNFVTNTNAGELMGDLANGDTSSLIDFLKSQDLKIVGSSGNDTLEGFARNDVITGRGGNDELLGGKGDDRLGGGGGFDTLRGGGGKDKLLGGGNDDQLIGGKGADILIGGGGGDTFSFVKGDGKDVIRDFKPGADTINFDARLFSDVDDILDHARKTDDGVLIRYDGGSVLIEDIKLSQLSSDDFSMLGV